MADPSEDLLDDQLQLQILVHLYLRSVSEPANARVDVRKLGIDPGLDRAKLDLNLEDLNDQEAIEGGSGPFGISLLPRGALWLEQQELIPDELAQLRTRPRIAILRALADARSRRTHYSPAPTLCASAGVTPAEFGREIAVLGALNYVTNPFEQCFQITPEGLAATAPPHSRSMTPCSPTRNADDSAHGRSTRAENIQSDVVVRSDLTMKSSKRKQKSAPAAPNTEEHPSVSPVSPERRNSSMIDRKIVDLILGLLYMDIDRFPGTVARDLLPKALAEGIDESRFVESFRFVVEDDRVEGRAIGGMIRLNPRGVMDVEKRHLAPATEIERRNEIRRAILTVLADARGSGRGGLPDGEIRARAAITGTDFSRERRFLESAGLLGGATIGECAITNAGFMLISSDPPQWDDRPNLVEAINRLRAIEKESPMSQGGISELTGIPLKRLGAWIKSGRIEVIADDHRWRIMIPTLIQYLEQKLRTSSAGGEA